MMSDDSENDGAYVENTYEQDTYYKKYKLLLDRCQEIQKHNEQLVYRLQQVKRINSRHFRLVRLLKERLLKIHGENWTVIPKESFDEAEKAHQPSIKLEYDIKVEPEEVAEESPEKPRLAHKKSSKRRSKSDRDPRAPKRPSNPFFQFCQEQRPILMEQLNSELKPGEVELTKQELTRRLAIKWKTLSTAAKKVYVDMYEKSKEKYAAEMSEYKKK